VGIGGGNEGYALMNQRLLYYSIVCGNGTGHEKGIQTR
jgi:hypothetical protein